MSHDYSKIAKQLAANYWALFLGLVVSPLLIVLLTRTLSVAEYGIYALLSVTVSISMVVLDLGLSQYIIAKLSGLSSEERSKHFFSLLFFNILIVIALVLLFLIPSLYDYVIGLLKLSDYTYEFSLVLVMIVVSVATRLFNAFFTSAKRLYLKSFLEFSNNTLWALMVLFYWLVLRELDLRITVMIWFLGISLTLMFDVLFSFRNFLVFVKGFVFNVGIFKKALKFSLPLVPFLMGGWIIIVSDRYILNYYWNSEAVGLYALVYQVLMVIFSIGVLLPNVFYPYIADAFENKKDYKILFNAAIKYSSMVVMPALVGFFVLRNELVMMISGVKYLPAVGVVPLLITFPLIAVYLHVMYLNFLLWEKTKILGLVFTFGAVLNIVLNFMLIPEKGMYGAAIATIVSYVVMYLVMLYFNRDVSFTSFRFVKIFRMLFAALIMGAVVSFVRPEEILSKLLTVVFGVVVYGVLLLTFGVFEKAEFELVKGFLKVKFK